MTKCVFCGKDENPHKGVHLIRTIGQIDYFCSNKCRINATKLKRDKRKVRWTEAFHITREKARVRAKAEKEKSSEPTKKETPKTKSVKKKTAKKK